VEDGITEYFSDRPFSCNSDPHSFTGSPFNPNNTDPLTITIYPTFVFPNHYVITLRSSKSGFNSYFVPSFDANTKILYGTIGPTFFTVSLYNQSSQPPVQ
jgi:hypothetical protein